jgi:Ser/Thr protein kinase RdoA (MazF antagonist)
MPDINARFPATYSTLSAAALASDVLPDYGVGDIADCRFYSMGVNDTYVVETARGETYFLRVYRLGMRSLSDVEYELDVLNHLHHKGVAVARPLPRQDGSLIRILPAPEGARYAVLFTAAVGQEPSYDADPVGMSCKYGQAVARIHNALQDFSSQRVRLSNDLEHLIDTPLKNIQPLLNGRAEYWAYIQRFAETVRQRIVELPGSALEQGVCHGDLQGFHAHIAPDGVMTFYDFDFCGYGYRAHDLAVFRWSARLDEQELVWWEPFLRGYREEHPINELDERAIPLFICARHVWHMGLHTGNAHFYGYGSLGDAYFERRIEWLRSLQADYLTTKE